MKKLIGLFRGTGFLFDPGEPAQQLSVSYHYEKWQQYDGSVPTRCEISGRVSPTTESIQIFRWSSSLKKLVLDAETETLEIFLKDPDGRFVVIGAPSAK